jgi:hypothetical protein
MKSIANLLRAALLTSIVAFTASTTQADIYSVYINKTGLTSYRISVFKTIPTPNVDTVKVYQDNVLIGTVANGAHKTIPWGPLNEGAVIYKGTTGGGGGGGGGKLHGPSSDEFLFGPEGGAGGTFTIVMTSIDSAGNVKISTYSSNIPFGNIVLTYTNTGSGYAPSGSMFAPTSGTPAPGTGVLAPPTEIDPVKDESNE